MKPLIPIGTRFGVKVVCGYETRNGRVDYWIQCDCGNKKLLVKHNLPRTISCGCLLGQHLSKVLTVHGETKTATWIVWDSMLARCNNKNHKSWPDYGGRGIKVCDRWLSYLNFKADMGERPPKLQLDRIDNDGNYEPSNCRWATAKENSNNRRSSVFVEYRGERLTVIQWARRLNMHGDTLGLRLRKGWPVDRAFETPTYPRGAAHKGERDIDIIPPDRAGAIRRRQASA